MKENILKFKVTDENGTEMEYEELYSFQNDENGKNYMVYTDNTEDEEGNLKIYAAIYQEKDNTHTLIPIENDEEWAFVEETVSLLEEENE